MSLGAMGGIHIRLSKGQTARHGACGQNIGSQRGEAGRSHDGHTRARSRTDGGKTAHDVRDGSRHHRRSRASTTDLGHREEPRGRWIPRLSRQDREADVPMGAGAERRGLTREASRSRPEGGAVAHRESELVGRRETRPEHHGSRNGQRRRHSRGDGPHDVADQDEHAEDPDAAEPERRRDQMKSEAG